MSNTIVDYLLVTNIHVPKHVVARQSVTLTTTDNLTCIYSIYIFEACILQNDNNCMTGSDQCSSY